MKAHIDAITDLLLGAAYADKRLEGKELAAIDRILCTVLGVEALPAAQKDRIKQFNPARLDVPAVAKPLAGLPTAQRHRLLELVASVQESDDEIDLAEDEYLRKVAKALNMSDAEIADLTLEVLEEDELAVFFEE